jgi:hypothetical protein
MPLSLSNEICEQVDGVFARQSKDGHFYQLTDPDE